MFAPGPHPVAKALAAPVLPPSATRQWISLSGLVVLVGVLSLLKAVAWQDGITAMLLLVGAIALPIIALEWWTRVPEAPPALPADAGQQPARIAIKLTGLGATYAAIATLYWMLPVYRDGQADVLLALVRHLAVPVAVITPFYVWLTDTRQGEPRDGCYMAGLAVLGRWPEVDRTMVRQYALGWLVKAFFLPIMVEAAHHDLTWFLTVDLGAAFRAHAFGWYEIAYRSLYFVEVLWAGAGYFLTFRLFDSHIRSTEPTTAGWLVCVLCYAPIWSMMSRNYFAYETGTTWGIWLADMPQVKQCWALAIIALLAVYAWATISFGVRFSNLTHRGILTNGPYRLTKHPAYLSKNLSWWLISVPFVTEASGAEALRHSLLLAGVNLIYYCRAKTEERHLSRDPTYVAYAAWIAEHGLVARAMRFGRQMRWTAPRPL
ncbi:isoprenylcysteine carboxylmethyltransferase family protein [Phreatobacter stygius]|nr:isoprenylcysteine carboxylmethyltransferase family protein [Phreatobacter stygius]